MQRQPDERQAGQDQQRGQAGQDDRISVEHHHGRGHRQDDGEEQGEQFHH